MVTQNNQSLQVEKLKRDYCNLILDLSQKIDELEWQRSVMILQQRNILNIRNPIVQIQHQRIARFEVIEELGTFDPLDTMVLNKNNIEEDLRKQTQALLQKFHKKVETLLKEFESIKVQLSTEEHVQLYNFINGNSQKNKNDITKECEKLAKKLISLLDKPITDKDKKLILGDFKPKDKSETIPSKGPKR